MTIMTTPDAVGEIITADYFKNIFTHCSDAIIIVDPLQNRIINANQAACALLGYSEKELQDTLVTDLHTHEVAAATTKRFMLNIPRRCLATMAATI